MTFVSVSGLSGQTDIQTANERMEVAVSFSVYDITVPVMVHGLNVMDGTISTTPKRLNGSRDLSLGGSLVSGSRPTC